MKKKLLALFLSAGLISSLLPAAALAADGARPETKADDYTAGYLWTFFEASGGYEKIFYGYSEDGLTWTKLNKDADGNAQPILVNDAEGSDLGVRDPHIIRSHEGDRYWILGTDLHAEGGGSGGSGWNQTSASQNIVVWESKDLVNWSQPTLVPCGFDQAGCVWAPEAIYDETEGNYVVYWSARDKSKVDTQDNALRVYVCRTEDFKSFTEPKVWLSEDEKSGNEVNIIDTTIAEDNGKFYRFSTSDWNTVMDVSDTLAIDDVFDVQQNRDTSVNGNWRRLIKRNECTAKGFVRCEGLTVYQLPDGRWCAMGDDGGYMAFLTNDLASGTFTKSSEAKFVDGRFRHGTVMRLSQEEEDRVLKAFKDADASEEPDPERKVLAEFTFDDDDTGFVSENAKAQGTYKLEDSLDGKAIYLNGTSDYLTVTAKDGSSLLTGATELTISYEAKMADKSEKNWIFYAAPNALAPVYLSENYLGIMEAGGSTKTERFRNGRPAQDPSAATGKDWVHVDVVVGKTDTAMYVNGEEQSRIPSTYRLTSILGNSSICQIGKANWDKGEYFKGWIDNVRIENRALNETEIKALADEFLEKIPFSVKDALVGTAPDHQTAVDYRGTDYHSAVYTSVDQDRKEITSYIQNGTSLKKVPLKITFTKEPSEITINGKPFVNGAEADLSEDAVLKVTAGKETQEWTVKTPIISNNPVLPGQYADPDIDYMDGKFWIFPTTDGYPGWSGAVFHAFSSEDMVNWTDEGIIMDLANDNPGKNDNGVQIAASTWAVGSAWAPTIEEKNGKYYFYYCGKFTSGESAIGVAVADDPAGPYTDKGEALLTVAMCRSAGVSMGQAIDPSIFTDDDGTSYITFGNSSAAIAELNDDMVSVKEGTLKQIRGLTDFRESVVITKANGKYHWTWSCDDANSPNYHVNYGVTDTLFGTDGNVNVSLVKRNLVSKDESKGILGSAHQSTVHVKDKDGKDRYFIAYHRFYSPINIFTGNDGLGVHRETCIDEIFFDKDGYMTVTPTNEGVAPVFNVPADKKALREAVDEENGRKRDYGIYTEETANALKDAMSKAEDILKDENIYTDQQSKVDDALADLQAAIDGLTEKGSEPDPGPGPEPEVDVNEWFTDVNPSGDNNWPVPEIQDVFDRGIMKGLDYEHHIFGTETNLSRAHLALMLWRNAGDGDVGPGPDGKTIDFKDVAADAEYAEAVAWASSENVGIVNGYKDENGNLTGFFDPAAGITREQLSLMMLRYAKYLKCEAAQEDAPEDALSKFTDLDKINPHDGGEAKKALAWVVKNGIVQGEGGSTLLNPQGKVNRAVAATFFSRLLNNVVEAQ